MAHKKIIDSVKKQGQVAIKDLDEFLRFIINESDTRTKMLSHPSRTIRSTITGSARRQTPPTISIWALPIPSDG